MLVAAENPLDRRRRCRARRRGHAAARRTRRNAPGAGAGRRSRHAEPSSARRRRQRAKRRRHPGAEPGRVSTARSTTSAIRQTRVSTPLSKADAKVISISATTCILRSNYQNVDRYAEVDLAIAADPQATLPALIEACKKLITADRRRTYRRPWEEDRDGDGSGARARARRERRTDGTRARSARTGSQSNCGT